MIKSIREGAFLFFWFKIHFEIQNFKIFHKKINFLNNYINIIKIIIDNIHFRVYIIDIKERR